MDWLKGKKTYLVAVAIGVVAALKAAGVIDAQTAAILNGFLYPTGLATLRAAK